MDATQIESQLPQLGVAELAELIAEANRQYWDEDAATLPDPLYDRMVEQLRRLAPDHPVLEALGPSEAPIDALDETQAAVLRPEERIGAPVKHGRPMLSLDKAYSADDVRSWADKFEGDLLVMAKLDGIACSLRFDAQGRLWQAATRGSGTQGEDITFNVLEIPGLPATIPVDLAPLEVRGEVYMTRSAFASYAAEFSNPRNTAAGAVRQKERKNSRNRDLSFGAYDVIGPELASEREKMAKLGELGIPIVEHAFVGRDEIPMIYEAWGRRRPELDYEIDGIVFRADLVAEQERLGTTGHHPRYAIAFKFQGDTGVTRLLGVEWGVSRTGTITPMALLEPIELSGAMIRRAGLHNLTRFRALSLSAGAMLEVTRRGGVIPYIERVVTPGDPNAPFREPEHCPACGGAVLVRQKREGEFLQCAEPEQCVTARLRELEHFAKVVDIQGFGPKIVNQVVDAGLLTTPADYYRLQIDDLVSLDRLGSKSAQNLLDRVAAKREIPLAVFLESLGIDHLGPQNATLIAGQFRSLAAIRAVTTEDLIEVKGIKEAIATAIVDGLAKRAELIDDLRLEVTVTDAPAPAPVAAEGPLAGRSFVFTGTLQAFDRKRAQAQVAALGGETPAGVSKTLSYLVVGAGKGAKSSKQKKAEKLIEDGAAIEILSEDEFAALVETAAG
jgi:DNA ligase (NAD+)